ncbi:OmpA family protein [Filimonas effusa]|uniref:Flagellar motor protein MotB n=1 Tax=Filimonas effusa TaxID=2508721 RepID=A0A4Q1D595_9BACT|nr:OmpA family protein [Filimonas effusa]RXK83528.1 flagellar motor protein MotB [Filimonas effusa]
MQRILYTGSVVKSTALTAFLALALSAGAQFSYDYLKAADNYFGKADYASSAAYYEKYLQGGKQAGDQFDPYTAKAKRKADITGGWFKATYQLAESYRLLKDYTKAAPLYGQLADTVTTQYPLLQCHYAIALRALGKYAEAEQALNHFLQEYTGQDQYASQARREAANLRYIQQQLQKKDVALYSMRPVSAGKEGASYAPVQLANNVLLFTATWPDSNAAASKKHTNRLYQAVYTGGNLTGIEKAALPANHDLHEGAATVSADGNTIYLTRWSTRDGKKNAAIYVSHKSADGNWQAPVALDTTVNKPGANSQQPYLMPNGRQLLFASDRAGGTGGYDIWIAELGAEGLPLTVANAGTAVNTPYNEQAPYFHEASATLVFASEGRTGMGGYDLFFSKATGNGWTEAQNFGYPVNSIKDDMYFTSFSKGNNILEQVVLSSDRADVCCLELFGLQKRNPLTRVSGQIIACDNHTPLAGVTVEVSDKTTGKQLYSGITDAEGRYTFTMETLQPLNGTAMLDGYVKVSQPLQTKAAEGGENVTADPVCMAKQPPVVEEVTVLNNVYYEFNKADIKPESYPALNDVVALLKSRPGIKVEIGGHTDNKGSDLLNQRLSEQRAANVVAYLVSKGIDKTRLTAKGYGASLPIAPNTNDDGTDNPEGREKNRRTEMKVLAR